MNIEQMRISLADAGCSVSDVSEIIRMYSSDSPDGKRNEAGRQ